MELRAEEISQIIRKQIEDYDQKVSVQETGTVLMTGDGIARVYGLSGAMAGEMLEFPHGIRGMVLNLEEDNVGVALLGNFELIKEGDLVKRTGTIASVPAGKGVLGRVVNALGQPVDGKGPIEAAEMRKVEIKAPGIVARQPVGEPMQTGIKAIDALIPIGPYIFKPNVKMLVDEKANKKIRLTEKETAILKYLYRAEQRAVGRETLLGEVWGYNAGVTTHTLETHVYRLRQKIEKDPAKAQILITDAGGYKLVP